MSNTTANPLLDHALALLQSGQTQQAELAFRSVLTSGTGNPVAWHGLGAALAAQKRHEDAISAYREALRSQPNNPALLNDLGIALMAMADNHDALRTLEQAVRLAPRHLPANYNLALALINTGNLATAELRLRATLELHPSQPEVLSSLGFVLRRLGRSPEAEPILRQAIALSPRLHNAHHNLGMSLLDLFRFVEAEEQFRTALEIEPAFALGACGLGNAQLVQGNCEAAEASFRRALDIDPSHSTSHTNLLVTMHYTTAHIRQEIFAEHRRWSEQHAPQERPFHHQSPGDGEAERLLRVGYVSADFRTHSVMYFFRALLELHDRNRFAPVLYSAVERADAVTQEFQRKAAGWLDVTTLGDKELAQRIFDDRIDILVDLSGHTGGNRLEVFGYKPAPVQVTWLGYPDTTGLPEIDYRFTDILADPPGAETFHTEHLVRLPTCFLCYTARDPCPAPSPPPALIAGHITFGSFNNLAKLSSETLRAWVAILQSVPNARLLIKGKSLRDPLVLERFMKKLVMHGIDLARTVLQGWTTSSDDHLESYARVDIALDTFPYNGTTTTCEALWMGVPVVTLAGETHAGRVGVSLLSAAGLSELIAGTEQTYIELATRLANDPQKLAHLRAGLRARMASSPLCNGPRFTREAEDAYRAMWRHWCGNKY